MECILWAGQHHARQKCANKIEEESIQRMYTPSNDIWLWDLVAKLATTQMKMERIMVGVTLKHTKSTNWIQKQSGVTNIIRNIRESKHR